MKRIYLVLLCSLFIMTGCSTTENNTTENKPIEEKNTLKFDKDGVAVFENNNRYGIVREDGTVLRESFSDNKLEFNSSGYSVFNDNDKQISGIVDNKGFNVFSVQQKDSNMNGLNQIYSISEDNYFTFSGEGSASINPEDNIESAVGIADINGKVIKAPFAKDITPFMNSDVASFTYGRKYGIIDSKGNIVKEPFSDSRLEFNGRGISNFEKDNKYGIVDNKGNIKKEPFSGEPLNFSDNGVSVYNEGGKFGLVNDKGEIVKKAFADGIDDFGNKKVTEYNKAGKNGKINDKGEVLK